MFYMHSTSLSRPYAFGFSCTCSFVLLNDSLSFACVVVCCSEAVCTVNLDRTMWIWPLNVENTPGCLSFSCAALTLKRYRPRWVGHKVKGVELIVPVRELGGIVDQRAVSSRSSDCHCDQTGRQEQLCYRKAWVINHFTPNFRNERTLLNWSDIRSGIKFNRQSSKVDRTNKLPFVLKIAITYTVKRR